MKKLTSKKISFISGTISGLSAFFIQVTPILAAIYNPALGENLGGTAASAEEASSGATFLNYFAVIWRAFISIGALTVLIYFLWGAFEWITAGNDTNRVGSARQRMINAAIGLIVLVSSFTIVGFVGELFFGEQFDILNLTFPTASPIGTP